MRCRCRRQIGLVVQQSSSGATSALVYFTGPCVALQTATGGRCLFQQKASNWETSLASCAGDVRQLWAHINTAIKPPFTARLPRSEHDLAQHFTGKVMMIRVSTASANRRRSRVSRTFFLHSSDTHYDIRRSCGSSVEATYMNLVQCIISRHVLCDKKFHVVLCPLARHHC